MKLYEIIPDLFVRGHVRRLRKNDGLKEMFDDYEFDMVVSMCNPYMNVLNDLVDEYVHCPIRDGALDSKSIKRVHVAARRIVHAMKNGKKVLVYCKRGRNRSCFVIAIAIARLYRIGGDRALRIVRYKRPNSISTPFFIKHLKSIC